VLDGNLSSAPTPLKVSAALLDEYWTPSPITSSASTVSNGPLRDMTAIALMSVGEVCESREGVARGQHCP
jgi:hypothetical protein